MTELLSFLHWLLSFLKRPAPAPQPVPEPEPQPEPTPPPPDPDAPRLHLFDVAKSYLGRDASPEDIASDEYGCAETVSDIIHAAFGDFPPDGKTIISTAILYQRLRAHPKFKATLDLLPGNIIISPTGYGNGKLANGHTGIFAEGKNIMSNSSSTGLFQQNYTIDQWVARYKTLGGFPIAVFQRVEA